MRSNSAPLMGSRGSWRRAKGCARSPGAAGGRSQDSAQSSAQSSVQPGMVGAAPQGRGRAKSRSFQSPLRAPAPAAAQRSAAQAMPGKPCRRVLATRWRKADQILVQPPGVSTEGHGAEVGGAEDRGTGGCCFACRLLKSVSFPLSHF